MRWQQAAAVCVIFLVPMATPAISSSSISFMAAPMTKVASHAESVTHQSKSSGKGSGQRFTVQIASVKTFTVFE